MQRKLEAYNHVLDQEMTRAGNAGGQCGTGGAGSGHRRQQQFIIHCKSMGADRAE